MRATHIMPVQRGERDMQTFVIVGAAMAVHTELGCGFLEAVYRAALIVELEGRGIAFRSEVLIPLTYKGRQLPLNYRADLICFGAIVVEVKAVRMLGPIDQAQAINYVRAAGLGRALLLNFGTRSLEYRRLVLTTRR